MNNYIVIMAGGVGSRFWPASKEERPKQFLDILGVGKSLLRLTYERCLLLVPNEHVLVITNERYRDMVQQHIPEMPARNILCEPSMNNTGPSVAYTALHIAADNPDAVFAIVPSDHVILKEDTYVQKLNKAFAFASEQAAIVTLGIRPNRPDTGYGYIEVSPEDKYAEDVIAVRAFKEKPDLTTAEKYLEAGHYFWNAGIFIWSVRTILNAFRKHAPGITNVLEEKPGQFGTDTEQTYINEVYPKTEKISVDYAILERADNVYTLPAEIGWSDLGTWSSLHAFLDKDENETVVLGANTRLIDTRNSIIRSDSEKVVVIKGLSNYIVVDEPDALLIYPKDDEQEIKQVVKALKKDG